MAYRLVGLLLLYFLSHFTIAKPTPIQAEKLPPSRIAPRDGPGTPYPCKNPDAAQARKKHMMDCPECHGDTKGNAKGEY